MVSFLAIYNPHACLLYFPPWVKCDVGLVCFQRDGGEPVPGCLNGEKDQSRTDYCVYDVLTQPQAVPSFSPSDWPSSLELSLEPSFFPSSFPTPVVSTAVPSGIPTLLPSTNPTDSQKPSGRPTIEPATPTQSTTKKLVSFGGSPPAESFPLSLCEGDCDVDAEVSTMYFVKLVLMLNCSLMIPFDTQVRCGTSLLSEGWRGACSWMLEWGERSKQN